MGWCQTQISWVMIKKQKKKKCQDGETLVIWGPIITSTYPAAPFCISMKPAGHLATAACPPSSLQRLLAEQMSIIRGYPIALIALNISLCSCVTFLVITAPLSSRSPPTGFLVSGLRGISDNYAFWASRSCANLHTLTATHPGPVAFLNSMRCYLSALFFLWTWQLLVQHACLSKNVLMFINVL